jgi:TatD DNase family protein
MVPYIDLHTHLPPKEDHVIAVCNLMLQDAPDDPQHLFTAGLHPWYADQLSLDLLSELLDRCEANPDFVAFGETGLDKACSIPMKIQMDVFDLHLRKAGQHGKPLIIHCVRAWEELIEIAANNPVIKILHGYNGSEQLTGRLLQSGFHFSIGKSIINPASKIHQAIHLIPLSSVFCETDTSDVPIQEIYQGVSAALKIRDEDLRRAIYDNYVRIRSELK